MISLWQISTPSEKPTCPPETFSLVDSFSRLSRVHSLTSGLINILRPLLWLPLRGSPGHPKSQLKIICLCLPAHYPVAWEVLGFTCASQIRVESHLSVFTPLESCFRALNACAALSSEAWRVGRNSVWTLFRELLSPAPSDTETQGGTNSQFHFLVLVTKCHGESEDREVFYGGEEDRGQRGTFFSNILALHYNKPVWKISFEGSLWNKYLSPSSFLSCLYLSQTRFM